MKNRTVTLLTAHLLLGSLLAGCGQTAVNTAESSSREAASEISSEDLSIQEQASSESLSVQEQVSSADLAAASEEEAEGVPYIRNIELDAGQKELIENTLLEKAYKFTIDPDKNMGAIWCRIYYDGKLEEETEHSFIGFPLTVYFSKTWDMVEFLIAEGEYGYSSCLEFDTDAVISASKNSRTMVPEEIYLNQEILELDKETPFLILAWQNEYPGRPVALTDYKGADSDISDYACFIVLSVLVKS